jgi:hypothetical protein
MTGNIVFQLNINIAEYEEKQKLNLTDKLTFDSIKYKETANDNELVYNPLYPDPVPMNINNQPNYLNINPKNENEQKNANSLNNMFNLIINNNELNNTELNNTNLNNNELNKNNNNNNNNNNIELNNNNNNNKKNNNNGNNNIVNYKISNTTDNVCPNIMMQLSQCNNLLEWPTSTNSNCRYCQHGFMTRPIFLPIKYMSDYDLFIVKHYIFCSFSCARSFNLDSNDPLYSIYDSLLHLLYKKVYNTNIAKIKLAPPIELLSSYNGELTITEYRNLFNDDKKDFYLTYPQLLYLLPTIKVIKKSVETTNTNEYRLKRNNPYHEKCNIKQFLLN